MAALAFAKPVSVYQSTQLHILHNGKMSCLTSADVRLLGDKLELDTEQLTDVRTPHVFLVHVMRYIKHNTKCGDSMMCLLAL
jgi:hypothetical protein